MPSNSSFPNLFVFTFWMVARVERLRQRKGGNLGRGMQQGALS